LQKFKELKSIFLIDDDLEDQEILELVLKDIDPSINCVFANTAEEALKILLNKTSQKPDLIFLDLNLPFMSGLELLSIIKNQDNLQDIPVIILSTSSREDDKKKSKELGAEHYITKPNTLAILKRLLQEVGL
jgi:CheY-like chemotaxis protein